MAEGSQAFSRILLSWYERYKRDLPWRETNDPYKIWLSEIILQQTRVSQGLPYFEKFVARFPTVEDLAAASQEEVLALWQGLGYYSRARNLHSCAMEIAGTGKGHFPSSYRELQKLTGIGSYTAAAIASFAFGEVVPVIDGNVYRVISRIFGLHNDIAISSNRKVFENELSKLIDHKQPGAFNQAMMEFGALQCKPANPDCGSCVFRSRCFAHAHHEVDKLPVKSKKVKVLSRHLNYFVFESDNLLAFNVRREKDIWRGLHDFYSLENTTFLEENEALEKIGELVPSSDWELIDISPTYKHVLTHRIVYARFFRVRLTATGALRTLANSLQLKLVETGKYSEISKPVLITNYLKATYF